MARRQLALAAATLHLLVCFADGKQMNHAPSSVTRITPNSVTAKLATEITFTGAKDGDKVQFALHCGKVTSPSSTIEGGKATITIEDEAEVLKLCYQAEGHAVVEEQTSVTLAVVSPTDTGAVTKLIPSTVTQGTATPITLTGAAKAAKAVFVPVRANCRDAVPNVDIDRTGKGVFTIEGPGGNYKLCYQAPGGGDSVEQNPETGAIALLVEQVEATNENHITSISPATVTSNVATTLKLAGAKQGDKAKFIAGTSSCEAETPPDKDIGAGHASFIVSGAGTYVLCVTAKGASDSVQQEGITLTVIAAGAARNMVGRWSSKQGAVDCSKLSQVPYCSSQGSSTCDGSFAIQSGIGYKCFWNTAIWPPKCDADMSTEERGMICQSNSCGGSPAMCW
ncbi:unnamed protein product [Durusdinium trenchii]|uniref:Uncharacterized protein n=2 Tax=Durusdinium trenchii TaxID=1381693 RepID=A0ABP0RUM1_9DINO